MDRALAIHSSGKWKIPVPFFYVGGFFTEKTSQLSASCGGPQQAGSNAAIESFWRCLFVELWLFLWSIRGPWRSLGSQGRPWGVSGTSPGVLGARPGVPGVSLGVPGACPGVPGVSPGVPGACPVDLRDSRELWGRPRHPWVLFHKDHSVI